MALHEHRHFGRAGAACFVTQSTLSAGIAELERVLGATLVERSKRAVRFTPVGEEVVARAGGVLAAAAELGAVAAGAREPLAGPLRLAVIPTIAPFLLPAILGSTGPAWPRLRLSVREMLTAAACEGVQRGTVDCVLMALPAACGEIETCAIATDPLLLAAPAADRSDLPVAVAAIDADRLLLLEDGHCLRDQALAACNLADRAGEARLVVATLQTMVGLVDAGLGITLLPQMAVAAGILAHTGVAASPIAGAGAERRIVLAWRPGHARRADFRLLGEHIAAVVANLPTAPPRRVDAAATG